MNDLQRLKIELNMKKAIDSETKELIFVWMNRAYELGIRTAGEIIGKRLSEEVRNMKEVSK